MPQGGSLTVPKLTIELVRAGVRIVRLHKGWPPRKIAEKADVQPQQIGMLLSGTHKRLLPDTIFRVKEFLLTTFAHDEDILPCTAFLAEPTARTCALLAHIAAHTFLVKRDNFADCSRDLCGHYLCHKYAINNDIETDILHINSYDEQVQLSTFSSYYKYLSSDNVFTAHGYILPIRFDFFALCGIASDISGRPQPYFVILENFGRAPPPYLRGISLDTEEGFKPWASLVYCGRIPNDTTDNIEMIGTREQREFDADFVSFMKDVIGGGAISLPSGEITVEEQKKALRYLDFLLKK